MTVKLNLSPEQEALLSAKASAQGMALEDYLYLLIEREINSFEIETN